MSDPYVVFLAFYLPLILILVADLILKLLGLATISTRFRRLNAAHQYVGAVLFLIWGFLICHLLFWAY